MTRTPSSAYLAPVLCTCLTLFGAQAAAFELFGYQIWGEAEEDEKIDVIDPLPYTVEVRLSGNEELLSSIESSSALWRGREEPASGKGGLLSQARGDYRRILATLYDQGYYGGEISIQAAGTEVADLTLAVEFPATVPITITVNPGPEFTFGSVGYVNPPTFDDKFEDEVARPSSVGFEQGQTARATAIGAASGLAIEQWRQHGHAKAEETDRQAIADHRVNELDVTIELQPGRIARYGPVTAGGSQRTDADFIEFMTGLPRGEQYDPDDIVEARDRLSRLGIFNSIRIDESAEIGEDGELPFDVTVQDRAPRSIGFGGTYSTIDGLGIEAYWQHRNLFGRAERLRFSASIERLLVSVDPSEYRYNLGVSFTKPGVWTPDTDFVTGALARQLDFENYLERSVSAQIGISQQFGRHLNGELFLQAARSRFEDDFGTRDFSTFSLVARGEYDRRRIDPLDAIGGYYLAADVEPLYEAHFGNAALRTSLEGRGYFAIDEDAKYVLAGRAKVGNFFGPPPEESPPNLLFFAGGGGSIRGYEYRSIGVEVTDPNGESGIVGGAGLFETSAEFRVRLNESFGAVGFIDAGIVTEDPYFNGETDLRAGAGLGVRYFTGIGALRADLATPINPRPQDSAVALYIGIGQAF